MHVSVYLHAYMPTQSVFFLQNEAGAERWPVTMEKLEKLQESFKPKLMHNPHSAKLSEDNDDGEIMYVCVYVCMYVCVCAEIDA